MNSGQLEKSLDSSWKMIGSSRKSSCLALFYSRFSVAVNVQCYIANLLENQTMLASSVIPTKHTLGTTWSSLSCVACIVHSSSTFLYTISLFYIYFLKWLVTHPLHLKSWKVFLQSHHCVFNKYTVITTPPIHTDCNISMFRKQVYFILLRA